MIPIIANIISLAGCALMVAAGLLKNKTKILVSQNIQCVLMGTANVLLGSITGGISNLINIARNIYCIKFKFTLVPKIITIGLFVALTAFFNNQGWLGWIPCAACVAFTLGLSYEDVRIVKVFLIVGELLWLVLDISIKNYAAAVFDIFTVVTNVITIVKLSQNKAKC